MELSPYYCPRCGTQLAIFRARQVVLHGCAGCGGAWLTKGQAELIPNTYQKDALDAAERAATVAPAKVDTRKPIACPVCRRKMDAVQVQGGVVIDQCSEHGTWFDAHEMKQISDAAAEARRAKFQQSQAKVQQAAGNQRNSSGIVSEVAVEVGGEVAAGIMGGLIEALFDGLFD